MFIDTHTHLYLENFDADRTQIIERCKTSEVLKLYLPNIDLSTIDKVKKMAETYPNMCYAMNGLHPCYVTSNVEEELKNIKKQFSSYEFCGVGEIGIDFYWDTTFAEEQIFAFKEQIAWSSELGIPFVIHSRSALDLTIRIVGDASCRENQCIFHCFDGTLEQANKIIGLGMKIGLGGSVTFKKSKLVEVVRSIPLESIVLETDSPYLAPSPHRGDRNESSYIPLIAKRIADIKEISISEVAEATTNNAAKIFDNIKI